MKTSSCGGLNEKLIIISCPPETDPFKLSQKKYPNLSSF